MKQICNSICKLHRNTNMIDIQFVQIIQIQILVFGLNLLNIFDIMIYLNIFMSFRGTPSNRTFAGLMNIVQCSYHIHLIKSSRFLVN